MLAFFCRKLPAVVAGLLVCVLAGISAFGQSRASHFTVTNLVSLRRSLQIFPEATVNIFIEGIVCDVSTTNGDLFIQDAWQTELLKISGLPSSLAAGQQVRLTATNCQARWQRQGVAFSSAPPVQIQVLREGTPPHPVPLDIGQPRTLGTSNVWATVEGQVDFAGTRDQGHWLELRSANSLPVHIEVLNRMDLPPELLFKSQLRVSGLAIPVTSAAEQKTLGLVALAGSRTIQVIELAPEAWEAYPLCSLADAVATTNSEPAVAHLIGWLRHASPDSDSPFCLSDGGARVSLGTTWKSETLVDTLVEAIGVLHRSSTGFSLGSHCLRPAPAQRHEDVPASLTSAEQVLRLKREEALRRYPVRLRGVVTSVLPGDCRNFVLQDGSHGIFIYATNPVAGQCPQVGEFWQVEGVSGAGAFSPFVLAANLHHVGAGQMPEPVRPAWDQMINGSLDNQYVEIQGIITRTDSKSLELLTHWGKIAITVFGRDMKEFAPYENKLVRLRGCLKALWDGTTHQLKFGAVRLDDVIIGVDQAAQADPFSLPPKAANQLKLFDYHAGVFRRVHVAGQIVGRWGHDFFLMDGQTGLRFIGDETNGLSIGDQVQVVGYPDLGRPSPMLHDTVFRITGRAPLPSPTRLSPRNLLQVEHDSTRVQIDASLVNLQVGRSETILEMRCELQHFVARLPTNDGKRSSWAPGSHLRLTGVYAGHGVASLEGDMLAGFDLLLNSPLDVQVLAKAPWWTFRRLMLAIGVLMGLLGLAGVWILLLRGQVSSRTAQLESANREREKAERARVLDEERLRIARDLHDDLGSSLTEITMLGSMGLNESKDTRGDYISQIVKKARASVTALDVIVWAVNPRENTLQSLADYLAGFADEFLNSSGIACRIAMPVSFPSIILEGRTRHELFLAAKEALNNSVRHGLPSEVELGVVLDEKQLSITVRDNGVGFDPAAKDSSHGLGNMRGRLEKLGGQCQIESAAGRGTLVTLRFPLSAAAC